MARPSSPAADGIAALEEELARLRDSEKMYRCSAELSARLVWAADGKGALTRMDSPYVAATGTPEESALGDGWLDIVHPDDAARAKAAWRDSVRTGRTLNATFRARIADESYRTVRSRAAPIRAQDGSISGWCGTTEDIEEELRAELARRAAEERLRESEEMHRYTLEMSQQIAWTAAPDGGGLVLSDRYRELTGMGDEDEAAESIHPDDRDRVVDAWTDCVATGKPYAVGCRLRMRDGSYRFMRVRAAPQRDEGGRIVRWYGVTEDVHEQELAERARRDVEARYRLAVQATSDAVWDYDIVHGTIDWSDHAGAMFGIGADPLGRTSIAWWEERIHPDDRNAVTESLARAIEGGESRWEARYRFRREDGDYADILDRGFVIRAPDGGAIRAVGAMADRTEQHRTESELRRTQAELIHVSRLSAMGTMASTLAHELNQPLTALSNFISGSKRMAERPDAPREVLVQALDGAEAAARRAGEILRRLRELVSRGKVSVQVEHLPQLIEEACELAFVDEHALGLRRRLELDPEALWVRVDRIQIQQVLINLVRNSVEAMSGMALREVVISTRLDRNMVEIQVSDTGAGIRPEHLPSLFSEFMTTKSGGMGLGLPISRTIVEAHGGKVWGGNRDGGGAAFRFTLPRAKRREPKRAL